MLLRDLLELLDYNEHISLWTTTGINIESGLADSDNIRNYGSYEVYRVSGVGRKDLNITIDM